MSNNSFTPGPWQWWTSNSFLRLSSQATGKDGDVIDSFKMSDGATSLSVKVADMHLIAAAPDLLEALQAAMDYIDAIPKDVVLPAMPGFDRDWVDGVISKALGEV